MSSYFEKIKLVFKDESLRSRILFVFGALALFRILAVIPIPSIDTFQLEQFFQNNQLLGLLNIFSGGGLSGLSLVMLGVGPYITASIVMQLMTVMVPRLKSLYHEEGQAGRMKFIQYSRILTVPLAAVQGFGFLLLLQRQGVVGALTPTDFVTNVIVVTAAAILLMWIGELMTEFGIGNGVSILIFAGIVAILPSTISQLVFTFDPSQIPTYIGFVVAAVLIIFGIVYMSEAERPIPITHSKQARIGGRGMAATSSLPLRINMAGVMPIIFALSILLFPQMIFNLFAGSSSNFVAQAATFFTEMLNNLWVYGILYFVLVFLFTFFYTAITFDPESVAENLQNSGAFIPGVRPGQTTVDYISKILSRVTFIGAVFLGLVAVLPIVMQAITGTGQLAIGGTALLIVVAVVIDVIKRIDAQVAMRQY